MPRKLRVRDKYTGDTYSFQWDKPENPTDDDIEFLINEQKRLKFPEQKSLWQKAKEPLTEVPSQVARNLSSRLAKGREASSSPAHARLTGFAEGAIEGLGDVITQMTSPLDIAATLAGGAALKAPARIKNAARNLFIASQVGTGARGAQNVYEGTQEGDIAKAGAGALELALSAAGVRGMPAKPSPKPKPVIKKKTKTPAMRKVIGVLPEITETGRMLGPSSEAGPYSGTGRLEHLDAPIERLGDLSGEKLGDIIFKDSPTAERPYKTLDTKYLKPLADAGNEAAKKELGLRSLLADESGSVSINLLTGRWKKQPEPRLGDISPEFAPVGEEARFNLGRNREQSVNLPSENIEPIGLSESIDRAFSNVGRAATQVERSKSTDIPYMNNKQLQDLRSKADAARHPLDITGEKGSVPISRRGIAKFPVGGQRQIYDIAEQIRKNLGNENLIDDLLTKAEDIINREKDPTIIDDNLRQIEGYLDYAKKDMNTDEIELFGTIRDIALDKKRQFSSPLDIRGEKGSVSLTGGNPLKGVGTKIKDTINLNLINQDNPFIKRVKKDYTNWVNTRAARKGQSFNVKEDFKDLDELGMEGIFAYNAGERGGRLADVQKFFDDYHADFDARRKALGVRADLGFKENYLPQIWENTPEEIAQALGNKRLTLKPRIAMKSIIDTYQEGIAKGLTPRYKTIPELMGYYTEVAEKNIADLTFFKSLREKGLIKAASTKKPGWLPLPANVFPTIKGKKGQVIHWTAPPEVHKLITNYLEPGFMQENLPGLLRGIQLTKDVAMASGLPGTAFNAHGFNMLRRSSAINGFQGFTKALKYMTKSGSDASRISKGLNAILPWESADARIQRSRQIIPEIMKSGGRLGVEGHEFNDKLASNVFGIAANKLTDLHRNLFETHLFDKMIPALKIDYWESAVEGLVNQGLSPEAAKKQASKAMNLAFAGVNYDELATNKHILDLSRAFLLAPDWYASNIGLSKNIVQTIFNPDHPGGKLYQNAGKGLLGMYIMANIANLVATSQDDDGPKFMWQNESGRTLDIDTGSYTMNDKGVKKKVYLSPFGTAFDAFKLPLELARNIINEYAGNDPENSLIEPSVRSIRNRTSLPVHSMINILGNTNDFGQRLYGEDVFGRDIGPGEELGNLVEQMANPLTPAYVKGPANFMRGRGTSIEALSNAVEAPLIFKRQESKDRRRRSRSR